MSWIGIAEESASHKTACVRCITGKPALPTSRYHCSQVQNQHCRVNRRQQRCIVNEFQHAQPEGTTGSGAARRSIFSTMSAQTLGTSDDSEPGSYPTKDKRAKLRSNARAKNNPAPSNSNARHDNKRMTSRHEWDAQAVAKRKRHKQGAEAEDVGPQLHHNQRRKTAATSIFGAEVLDPYKFA